LADPGGWAWTDLAGGVPDADDTAGVLLALRNLGQTDDRVIQAVLTGVNWLIGLQNRDGGLPTFCKGWGTLPFDRSSPDITAHGLLALSTWLQDLPLDLKPRAEIFLRKGIDYLAKVQRKDGSWVPLWFGNQAVAGQVNPTYGTSRVLRALRELAKVPLPGVSQIMVSGIQWLLSARNSDGGWGGAAAVPSSIEETALAVEALAGIRDHSKVSRPLIPVNDSRGHVLSLIDLEALKAAAFAGVSWLIKHTEGGKRMDPSPIGFYFAKLWYFERLYPLIFTVAALEKVRNVSAAQMLSRYS
jgi:squalene-hopene/tetraprenyl-beta-curcumene cyclase